jgi:hypothetical protein
MPVGFDDRAVNQEQPVIAFARNDCFAKTLPAICDRPAAKSPVDAVPLSKSWRQIAPRRAGT